MTTFDVDPAPGQPQDTAEAEATAVDIEAQASVVTDPDLRTPSGTETEERPTTPAPDTEAGSDDYPPFDRSDRPSPGEFSPRPRRRGLKAFAGAAAVGLVALVSINFVTGSDEGDSPKETPTVSAPALSGEQDFSEAEVTPDEVESQVGPVEVVPIIQTREADTVDVRMIITPDADEDKFNFANYGNGLSQEQFDRLGEQEFPSTFPETIDPSIGAPISGIEHTEWTKDEIDLHDGGFELVARETDNIFVPPNFSISGSAIGYHEAEDIPVYINPDPQDTETNAQALDERVKQYIRQTVLSDGGFDEGGTFKVEISRTTDSRGNVGWFIDESYVNPRIPGEKYSIGTYMVATERMVYTIGGYNSYEEGLPDVEEFSAIALRVDDRVNELYEEYEDIYLD